MLPLLGSVIRSTLGFLRNKAVDKLKGGDITTEKLREIIMQDLHSIKRTLDGLSRKDLLASVSFLKEGLGLLHLAVGEFTEEDKHATSKVRARKIKRKSRVLNEALALIHNVHKAPNSRLARARECFKAAREKATEAFWNEALKMPDRMMAAKLRFTSKILECIEDPQAAIAGCMLYLEELHGIPEIGATFSTYLSGGLKSNFKKDSRAKILQSVLSFNFAVSDFVTSIPGESPNVRNWPRIHLSSEGETTHPLIFGADIVKEIFNDDNNFQLPENHVSFTNVGAHPHFAINSKEQLIVKSSSTDTPAYIVSKTEEKKEFFQLRQPKVNTENREQQVKALAIDHKDNVFVIVDIYTSSEHIYVLFVFNSSGKEQYEKVLDIKEDIVLSDTCVITHDGHFMLQKKNEWKIYIFDRKGELINTLYSYFGSPRLECTSDQNELIMSVLDEDEDDVVRVWAEKKLKREIEVDGVQKVNFNYAASKIEVLTETLSLLGTARQTTAWCIHSYSADSDTPHERLYIPTKSEYACYVSHPCGPSALIRYSSSSAKEAIFM